MKNSWDFFFFLIFNEFCFFHRDLSARLNRIADLGTVKRGQYFENLITRSIFRICGCQPLVGYSLRNPVKTLIINTVSLSLSLSRLIINNLA